MNEHVTFAQIQEVFESFLLLEDKNLVWLTLATVIGNNIPGRRPIWLMLVAPPSSGKTTALNALAGLKIFNRQGEVMEPIQPISDLTENSFASGARSNYEEPSLLNKIPDGGMMVFKDFTSILSKNADAKRIIMGQLREIYDGSYVKRTGTGHDIKWQGKIGALAGVTESIYQHLESMSVMGDRFMLYQVRQPNRKAMLRFKLDQERNGTTEDVQMPLAKELVHAYMQRAFLNITNHTIKMTREQEDEIIAVADFCTMVRSGIITDDFSGQIQFVPQPEMPARMFEQMLALGATFLYMRRLDNPELPDEAELTEQDRKIMYKIAYDSIPITRRIALNFLIRYSQGVGTEALAIKTNYPSPVVGKWLEQLNALGVVKRTKNLRGTYVWRLHDEYIGLMEMLQGTKAGDEKLEEASEDDAADRYWQQEMEAEQAMLSRSELEEAYKNEDF